MPGEDGDDEVAVDEVAVGVDGQHAVAVAVEGEAQVEPVGAHERLQRPDVRRPAAVVDVAAVRFGAQHDDVGAALGQAERRRLVHRAVGAVDGDAQAGQIERDAAHEVPDVALERAFDVRRRARARRP